MIHAALKSILQSSGLPEDLADKVRFIGADPVFPTPFRMGTAGAAALGALGLAVARLRKRQSGAYPDIEIDVRSAAAALRSDHYIKVDGSTGRKKSDGVGGLYPVAGGGWNFLHCNLAPHRAAAARVLGVEANREAMTAATLRWNGAELEKAINEAGGCATVVRTPPEWKALANTRAVAAEPLVEIRKIGDSAPIPLPAFSNGAERPLEGIRVLDLTRVLAGPTCGRLLAEYGADVLKITCEQHPDSKTQETDTGYGKRKATLDIAAAQGGERFRELLRSCDVFSQAYRADAMSKLGYSPEQVMGLRPGIVYASLNAFGFTGEWRNRRGFDTVVQCASGMAHISGKGQKPKTMPATALDYTTGHLMAFGVLVALERRAEQGGSYSVKVSLARTCEWLTGMGLVDDGEVAAATPELSAAELARWVINVPTPQGVLTRLRPLIRYSDGSLQELPPWKVATAPDPRWL